MILAFPSFSLDEKEAKNQAAANLPHYPAPAPDAAAGPRRSKGSVDVLGY